MMDGVAKNEEVQRTGRAVAARRGELGLTQQELADDAGVDIKTVYNLESGARWPIAKNRAALAVALHWEPNALAVIAAGETPEIPAAKPEPERPRPRLVPPLPAGTRYLERGNVLFPDLSPDLRPEAVPHYDDYEARIILAATAAAARRGITLDEALAELPDAAAVFPEAERGQERMWWDLIKSWELPSGQYSYRQMAHQLAVLRVLWDRAETGQSSAGAGLAAARLPADSRTKPG